MYSKKYIIMYYTLNYNLMKKDIHSIKHKCRSKPTLIYGLNY